MKTEDRATIAARSPVSILRISNLNVGGTTEGAPFVPGRTEGFFFAMTLRGSLRAAARAIRALLIAASSLYGLAIVLLALLWTAGADAWWVSLTNIFAALLFAPLIVLVPAALLVPSRWLRGAVVAPLAIFFASFGPQLLPPLPATSEGTPLRVVTFNLQVTNRRVDEVIAAIADQNADVVVLQELSPQVAAAAEKQLSDIYPYQVLSVYEWPSEMGLLSRYPLREAPAQLGGQRQRVTLDIDGREVTLLNIHLPSPDYDVSPLPFARRVSVPAGYDDFWREQEARLLLREIDTIDGPLIAAGDFNTGDREPLYQAFAARLRDVYRETAWGFGFTFPSKGAYFGVPLPLPVVRIDYVWTRGVTPVAAQVKCGVGGSDHCMLIADLRVSAR